MGVVLLCAPVTSHCIIYLSECMTNLTKKNQQLERSNQQLERSNQQLDEKYLCLNEKFQRLDEKFQRFEALNMMRPVLKVENAGSMDLNGFYKHGSIENEYEKITETGAVHSDETNKIYFIGGSPESPKSKSFWYIQSASGNNYFAMSSSNLPPTSGWVAFEIGQKPAPTIRYI